MAIFKVNMGNLLVAYLIWAL